MDRLQGKVAVVTGAGGQGAGTGRAAALMMAAEGARVAAADISLPGAEETAQMIRAAGGEAIAIEVDCGREESIKAMIDATVAEWGTVTVLLNHVGSAEKLQPPPWNPILDLDVEEWMRVFNVSTIAPALGCKYAVPHMIKAGGGSIINTSSVNALRGDLLRAAYGVCKLGMSSLTMTVATLFGRDNVRCNTILNYNNSGRGTFGDLDPGNFMLEYERNQLIPRKGRPEDFASLAVFLASDESGFITGRHIPVDGGVVDVHMPNYSHVVKLPTEGGGMEENKTLKPKWR